MNWIIEHKAIILGALLALSEVIGEVPSIKASSIFGLIKNALLALKG